MAKLFMQIVQQAAEEVTGVLLLAVRVIKFQKWFEDLLSADRSLGMLSRGVKLVGALEVTRDVDKLY